MKLLRLRFISLAEGIDVSGGHVSLIFVVILFLQWTSTPVQTDALESKDTSSVSSTKQATPSSQTTPLATSQKVVDAASITPDETTARKTSFQPPFKGLPLGWVTVRDRGGFELRQYNGQTTFHRLLVDSLTGEVLSIDRTFIYRLSGSLKLIDQLLVHPQLDCGNNKCMDYNATLTQAREIDVSLFYPIPNVDYILYCGRDWRLNCSLIRLRPLEIVGTFNSSFLSRSDSETMVTVFDNLPDKSSLTNPDSSVKIFTAKSHRGLSSEFPNLQPSISSRFFTQIRLGNSSLFNIYKQTEYDHDSIRHAINIASVNKSAEPGNIGFERPTTSSSKKIPDVLDRSLDSHSPVTGVRVPVTGVRVPVTGVRVPVTGVRVAGKKIGSVRDDKTTGTSEASEEGNLFVSFSKAAKESNYTIQYVYGFESGNHVYWITVQRDSLHPTDNYDTRLVRVCKHGASGINSYSELSLTCRKKTSLSTFYNIATAGYLGQAEGDTLRRFALREGKRNEVLYILMGRSKQGEMNAEAEFGLGLCMYFIRDIERSFSKAERDCYMGHGRTVAWLDDGYKDCKKNEQLAAATTREPGFCASAGSKAAGRLSDELLQQLLPGISSRYPLSTDTNYTSDSHLGTSIAIDGQRGNTVAFIGTNNGHLLKVLLNGFNSPPLLDLDLNQGLDQSYPVRQIKPDASSRNLYTISGPRITRIPMRSCSLYKDCSSCLLSSDPLGCGWCINRCSTHQLCPATSAWSNDTCSPVIYSFTPYAGPVEGGTRLIVVGQNFDFESSVPPKQLLRTTTGLRSQAYVKVGDVECFIEFRNSTTVSCITGDSTGRAFQREITVSVSDSKPLISSRLGTALDDVKLRGYKIHGTASTGSTGYMYKVASVNSFTPLVGSRSGGIVITIYGSNLDIGSTLNVSVTSQPCPVLRVTVDTVICRTSALPVGLPSPPVVQSPRFEALRQDILSHDPILSHPDSQTPKDLVDVTTLRSRILEEEEEMRSDVSESLMSGPVVVTIDDAVLSIPGLQFHYRDDPTVVEILRRGSILSGGMKVEIKGYNLHTIQQPTLQVWTKYDDRPFITSCQSNPTGRKMTCRTPNITLTFANVTSERPLTTRAVLVISSGERRFSDADSGADEDLSWTATPKVDHDSLTAHLMYYVDPVIEPFVTEEVSEDLKVVRRFYLNENYLDIKGQNMDLVATLSDYKVTIGGSDCKITQLMKNSLMCQPSKSSGVSLRGTEHDVIVKVGNLEVVVGLLIYTERQSNWLITWMIVPIMCLLCIVTLLFLLWIRKSCQCMKSWKAEGKEGLAVSYIHIPDQRSHPRALRGYFSNGPLPSANIINNAYWLNWQPSNNDQSVTQPNGPIVNADSWQLVYDSNIFIPREDIVLLDIIGQGHFGCVYRGVQLCEDSLDQQVAVKTLKALQDGYGGNGCGYGTSPGEVKKFLEEALTMREFEHANVLSLIGVSMDKDRLPLVVLPYLKHGDLLSYIRNENNSPTVKELMVFGIQIAEGMTYLSSLKFVHRDLAARNCMLDDDMKVKVADFGLSRDVYERDYYSSDNRRSKLPVKWMAPESLEMGIYSSKTDVWSYGVVLWELMTRGVCPYPEVDNWDIVKFLSSGRRMAQPMYCPDTLYETMLRCWHPDCKARPGFEELAKKIRQIIASMENFTSVLTFKATGISTSLENFAECRYNNGVVQYSNITRWSRCASTDCLTRSERLGAEAASTQASVLNDRLIAVTTTV